MPSRRQVNVGEVFGALTVIQEAVADFTKTGWARYMPLVRCGCGHEWQVPENSLRSGNTTKCRGCSRQPRGEKSHLYKHGGAHSPENQSWLSMRQRCRDQNAVQFKDYGGRGITVCDRWRDSFENFFADMGPKPSPKHSLDRIDNDGNYEPGNCRWATRLEQGANTRASKFVTFKGERMVVCEAARRIGIVPSSIYSLARSRGFSVQDAVIHYAEFGPCPIKARRKAKTAQH